MPKTPKNKPPADYAKIEPTIAKLQAKLKDAQRKSITSESKHASLWPILKLNHQIARYVFSMYQKKAISKELYEYLLRQKYVDANLIAKWKKQGYENLCCVRCIIANEHNHQTTCLCRVPKGERKVDIGEGCVACGCLGCSSKD